MRKIVPFLVIIVGLLILINFPKPRDEPNDTFNQSKDIIGEIQDEINEEEYVPPSRYSKIPGDVVKVLPINDLNPPKSESNEYYDPVPVPGLVNTNGGEDSAFILPDGETLYFFFTPDVRVPVEEQVLDKVTGIYRATKNQGSWGEPTRVLLQDPDKLALDGCEFIQGNEIYFGSAREGYTGLHWFKAEQIDGKWVNWVNVDDELKTEENMVGELHISSDGQTLYFHSTREDGKGLYDIWVSEKDKGEWGHPVNLDTINSEGMEGWPCLSQDGKELWFSKDYGIWRSKKIDGEWTTPERMFFPLAGEPSIDRSGNVYFTHHFFKDDVMLEADIYVAYKKQNIASNGLLKGVSVSPKSFDQDDFLDFLEKVKQTQDVLLWAGDWMEVYDEEAPQTFSELATQYDYTPIIEVGHYIQESGELFRPLNNYKQIYLESTIDYARQYQPKYFGIGVEINVFAEKNPDAFEEFIPFYNEVYDAIKEVSPDSKVFTVFQLEKMKGLKMWELEEGTAHWEMINRFKTDIVAFTTYPGIFYRNVSDIPPDHYTEILSHTSKPIAFTEIGWHSAASPTGWESSEQEQAEFIETFFDLTTDLDMEIAVWSFMYDPEIIEPFNTMGLITVEGYEKLAWDEWIK